MIQDFELAAMRQALDLAQHSPYTSPNPKVACVLLDRAGNQLGVGVHQGPGSDHAEIAAIKSAVGDIQNATAIVTLEPCNHTGRTGPCSQALIEAGISRVIFATPDPNRAAAGGAEALLRAGVEVECGVLEAEARLLNRSWLFAVEHERPWVTCKIAATLDGKVAAIDGSSKWITGAVAREFGHQVRGQVDAIAVGTATARADNPSLTDRRSTATRQPMRVILGTSELEPSLQIFDNTAPTIQLRDHDPEIALQQLFAQGVRSLLIEGGPTVQAAFLRANLVDEILWFVAPKLLGTGLAAVADLGIETLASAVTGQLSSVRQLDQDLMLSIDLRSEYFDKAQ